MNDGFIKIIDDTDDLLREALNHGDALATPRESQMLLEMTGVSINTKPRRDGRYQGYILKDGQKKYLYGKTREEVAEKMKSYFREENAPKRKKKEKKNCPTFGEYYARWLSLYKEPVLKAKSLLTVRDTIKPALLRFGDVPLDKISADDVQALLLSIRSTRSRDICRATMNQIFNKAVISDLIKKNPCLAVEIEKHVYGKKKALTREEEERFLRASERSPHFLLFRLLLATGIRIGEALALKISDFDTSGYFLSITKDVVFLNGKRIEQETPKTKAGNRTIPIPKSLCDEIVDGRAGSETAFPTTYNAVSCALKRIAKEENLTVSAHILRHTYATRLEQAGVPSKVRQYLLGHSDSRMTENIYTDIQAESIERFSEIIRKL